MSSHKAAPVIPDPKGYESGDLDLAPIVKWMTFLEVFVLAMTIVTIPIYLFFLPKTTVGDVTRFAEHPMPEATPKIQAQPKIEMKDFRMDEQAKSDGYSWVDKSKGEARIPVDKAMEMVIEKGADGVVIGTPPAEKPVETTPVPKDAPEVDKPTDMGKKSGE